MSKFGKLMYWGGDHSCPVMMNQIRRANPSSANRVARRETGTHDGPVMLEFSIQAGRPSNSRSQWARVSFRGLSRGNKGVIPVLNLFERWDRVFVTFDGVVLNLFTSKNTTSILYQLEAKNIKSINIDQSKNSSNFVAQKNLAEDVHDVIVFSVFGDQMHLR
jgi:hypothetical protein